MQFYFITYKNDSQVVRYEEQTEETQKRATRIVQRWIIRLHWKRITSHRRKKEQPLCPLCETEGDK